tara:strand:+ start:375 stop:1277 length:903 start_codon:yes stop_codon:yes gene_type:complete
MKIETEDLKKMFNNSIKFNEILSKFSWFNLGGPAEIFFKPENENQLSKFLNTIKNLKINIIGAGSNTLIRDGGIKGVTIKLSTKFSYVKLIEENTIEVGASTMDKKLSQFATDNSITGFEFLSCIPGSVGGAIKMNSGCYGDDISKILTSIKVIDFNGKIFEIENNDINFQYRGCNLPNDIIILSAKFEGKHLPKEKVEEKQKSLIERKKNSQPSQIKTCGSTFKNTLNKKAWELIKNSDCAEMSVGDAKISKKHCNFFVNEGKASSADIEELMNKVNKKVFEKTGIKLELEIKVVGEYR